MRGREKNTRTIKLNGNIYLKYECEGVTFESGDIMFYLNDDANPKNNIYGNYRSLGQNGYFKMEVFDGKYWRGLKVEEFFENKENSFHKKELPIDCYNMAKDSIDDLTGTTVYYDYRDHYTVHEYIAGPYKGKKQLYLDKKLARKNGNWYTLPYCIRNNQY